MLDDSKQEMLSVMTGSYLRANPGHRRVEFYSLILASRQRNFGPGRLGNSRMVPGLLGYALALFYAHLTMIVIHKPWRSWMDIQTNTRGKIHSSGSFSLGEAADAFNSVLHAGPTPTPAPAPASRTDGPVSYSSQPLQGETQRSSAPVIPIVLHSCVYL